MSTFQSAMSRVADLYAAGQHAASLRASRGLTTELSAGPIVDADHLGWAVYYQFRCLYALGEHDAAWELLHGDDFALCQVAPKNEAWMWSVGSELAALRKDVDDILRCGEACFALRYATDDPLGQGQCCTTVCNLLAGIDRADRNRDFARELVRIGRAYRAVVPAIHGVRFLLAAFENGGASEQDLVDAVADVSAIDPGAHLAERDALLERIDVPDRPRRSPYRLDDTLEARAFRGLASGYDKRAPLTVESFMRFATMVDLGFERVGYRSHLLEDGVMYWITDAHAEAIGRALAPTLRSFHLALTCFEGRGFELMTRGLRRHVHLDELVVNHRSGDEVTVSEARGLAHLLDATRARRLSLWACEYGPDALATLTRELAGNPYLVDIDICDTSREEPDDRIHLPALTELVRRNQ